MRGCVVAGHSREKDEALDAIFIGATEMHLTEDIKKLPANANYGRRAPAVISAELLNILFQPPGPARAYQLSNMVTW